MVIPDFSLNGATGFGIKLNGPDIMFINVIKSNIVWPNNYCIVSAKSYFDQVFNWISRKIVMCYFLFGH